MGHKHSWPLCLLFGLCIGSKAAPMADCVLSPNVQVVHVIELDGKLHNEVWTPTAAELAQTSLLQQTEHLSGFHADDPKAPIRMDYISYNNEPHSLSWNNRTSTEHVEAIVEISIVCDKSLSDLFNQDRQKILNYFTVYMWQINLAYKTLPSSDIKLVVTSILMISTKEGQPFIEKARNEEGIPSYNRILGYFAEYMYTQIGKLPQFDIAMSLTNEQVEWWGGLAFVAQTCGTDHNGKKFVGSLSMSDHAGFNSMAVAAHEIGHVLGAPHDESIAWCNADKYIMSGGGHFFSPCSDITINEHLRSQKAACVRDPNLARPVVDPSYNTVPVPSLAEQCYQLWEGNTSAWIQGSEEQCEQIDCRIWIGSAMHIKKFGAIGNSDCGESRVKKCFRGRCIEPGVLIVNVETGMCMRSSNLFTFDDEVKMVPCPSKESSTQLDQFRWNGPIGTGSIATPYSIQEELYQENDDKCLRLFGEFETGFNIKFEKCSKKTGRESWIFVDADVGTDEMNLIDGYSQRCVRQVGDKIELTSSCAGGAARWFVLESFPV